MDEIALDDRMLMLIHLVQQGTFHNQDIKIAARILQVEESAVNEALLSLHRKGFASNKETPDN